MKHLKISIPDGYEIDEALSTFENIVFKPTVVALPKTWKELNEIDGYFIHSGSGDSVGVIGAKSVICNRNIFATKEQAEAYTALAQLSQLMKVYNDGWVPDWTDAAWKYVIYMVNNDININYFAGNSQFLSFKTKELRDEFLENFKDLIIIAKPLL
jgi:hypothetical protein